MNRKLRFATVGFVAVGLSAVVGLAAKWGPSAETWAGVVRLLTCGALALATIGADCRGPDERPRFAGFAAFGWGYLALAHWYTYSEGPLPTVAFLPGSGEVHGDLLSLPPIVRIAHDAWALAFAVLGSILAGSLVPGLATGESAPAGSAPPDGDTTGWWRKPACVGLLGLTLLVGAALLGWRADADIGAGTVFLLTWALMGLAILGAALGRGRRRDVWVGAASFGLGYLVLAFGPVFPWELPTNHLLNAVLRPGGPSRVGESTDDELTTDEESGRIRKALEQPVSLHFPEPTALRVVLGPIRDAIRGPSGKAPVFYASLYELRLTLEQWGRLLVSIDRESIPAKDALRLGLSQIGLAYRVQSGYIRILADVYRPVPFEDDSVMIAGHSLLALIAAAIGGVAARLVVGLCGRPGTNGGQPAS